MSTITGTFETAAGQPVKGRVGFTPDSPLLGADEIVVQRTVWADLDATGAFTVTLDSTDTGNPTGWTYAVTEQFPDGKPVYHILLPEGTFRLEDLAPVPASAGNAVVRGPVGPSNALTVGSVAGLPAGSSPAAALSAPVAGPDGATTQQLSLSIPKGDPGGFVAASYRDAGTIDLNTQTTFGIFYFYGTSAVARNGPFDGWWGYLEVFGPEPNYLVQRATYAWMDDAHKTDSAVYLRARVNGAWSQWRRMLVGGAAVAGSGDATGAGSPESVVTAPVGTYYTDTAGTNGAWRWLKKSGSGNTGWKPVIADTGWRVLSSWDAAGTVTGAALPAGFTPAPGVAGKLSIRRQGDKVQWRFAGCQWSNSSVFAIPAGFGPSPVSGHYNRVALSASTGPGYMMTGSVGATSLYLGGNGWALTDPTYGATLEYLCDDAWPAVLPGT